MMSNPQSSFIDDIKRVLGGYNKGLKPRLAQCEDVHNILQLVHENSSLDEISVLEVLVNEFNIAEATAVIEEYKGAVEKLKMKLRQFLEEELFKVPSLLDYITIVIDKDTSYSVLNGVQRLSSALLSHYMYMYVRVNVIRGDISDGSMWDDSKQDSLTDTYVGPTVQSKDTCTLTTEVPAGTAEKDEDQVMLLQEKVESIQKELKEEKELHKKEKQFHEQVTQKYKEEILQLKEDLIQKEKRLATLTEQEEEVGDLKHKTEQYEELRSDNELTHKQLEELQEKLKEEIKTSSSLMKQNQVALREKEELQRKIDDLQQELELQQAKDHKEVSGTGMYTITQSGLHELPTGQYTMNNDEEYDINVKDSNDEVETQIETENKEIQTTQTTLDKEIQFNYLVPSQDNLEGLSESQIAGKKLFLVQGDKPQLMNWEEYGLRISITEGSLSASETVEVSVLALVGGHFKFPDNTRLVSAVYAISTSPLLKSLRIEMQNCIDLSDPSLSKYLKFAVAPVHTASLPYQFSLIEGGEFPAYQRYRWIE
uniref:Death domain-containing protein n=1 Tax=Amphimedon queenslandica TaxID=400682 RepID=A0A1X7TK34_AMPQE